MRLIFTFLISFSFFALLGQSNYSPEKTLVNTYDFTIYSVEYKEGKKKLEAFIRNNNFVIIKQEETKSSHYYNFNVPASALAAIDSFTVTLGYVSSKQLKAVNNESALEEAKLELEHLELKKKEYEVMLNRIDSVKSDKYYSHWEKIRDIETELYARKKKIKQLDAVGKVYLVKISIHDDQTSPTNSKITFVHMPGVEYSYLYIENPKAGISYQSYQGVSLKYLFTKGKSYFSLGALKADQADKNDSLSYDELFNFAFGQDFYSRHFGRGNNRFMNLYIGYQLGIAVTYSQKITEGIPFASPCIGVELFKNKYILIDGNIHYFLPAHELNRNLRGWKMNGSLNFVF